ncbi:hypothetical protein HOD83_02380 [Candidatus Woesearchaeota archaeon]|jgi:hypothetical protein|nr:hypothetical protein [Candidatus Woesearchaeota archaeon]MBT4114144.1 hypothetical protein [Candidatus Woesearchaeota archaeon]MBT4248413.1 hypothetical protein [Candidatus Woesearchaeota archaeon]MBT6048826.1 hypothetical protein [Candidatus Scalindua sp.]
MSKKLGRKAKSQIRDEMVDLLFFLKEAYGYDLYKKYCKVYDKKISMRSIYYHLNKGVELGVFNLKEIRDVKGDFSWGSGVKQVIFQLGVNAQPSGNKEIANKLRNI